MNILTTKNYESYFLRIIKEYENTEDTYIYDGSNYYYVISVDKQFKKSLKLLVYDFKNDVNTFVYYPLKMQLLEVVPIKN
jgi:hypothetical protein